MKIEKLIALYLLMLLIGCGESSNETLNNQNSSHSEIIDTLESGILELDESDNLSEWETLERDYPLLYGEDISDNVNLSKPLLEFAQKIKNESGKFEKIDAVYNAYKALDLNENQKDTAFFMYIEFLESIQPTEDEMNWSEDEKFNKKYGKYGLDVFFSEGMAGLTPNMYKVSKKFTNDISDDLKKYVGIDNISDKQMFDDAALMVSWNEFADYVLDLEDHVILNADNRYYKYMLLSYSWSLETLLWGVDNTPTIAGWGDEPRKLDEVVSKTYDRLIADKKHKTGLIINEHKNRLTESDFGKDWETRWSPSNEEIESFLGIN